jgi:gamma-glutamyltranspeptidase/glutathione hydrolase
VVADEPRAAVAAREILSAGGSAGDAAVALAFALSVTLPSRVGLGASGACLAYAPGRNSINGGAPEAIMFTAVPAAPGGARPASVPMLARGMFALHARYGRRPMEMAVSSAEQLARFGTPASRALVQDLAVVGNALMGDPFARAVFAPDGRPLEEGAPLRQTDLGATLAQIRSVGVGDLYQGQLARRLEEASRQAGAPVTLADMRGALPTNTMPLVLRQGNDNVAFLPPPADGGLAAAAAFAALQANANDIAGAEMRAAGVAATWRAQGGSGDPMAMLSTPVGGASLPSLPASTSFGALDKDGNAVMCSVSMGNLFGTGRMAPGLGFLIGASPAAISPPLISAALAWNERLNAFRAAVGGSGQSGAPMAVALGMMNTLRTQQPMPQLVPEPGRANVIACARYLPDSERSCGWATDPRGFGLAAGSN